MYDAALWSRATCWIVESDSGDICAAACIREYATKSAYPRTADAAAPNVKTVELAFLFTSPSHRGLGLGRSLLREAIAEASRQGYHEMRLLTLKDVYAVATRLYEGEGFDTYEEGPGGPHYTLLYMRRCLLTAAAHTLRR